MNIFNTSRSYAGIAIASVLALGISFAGAMVASAQETTNGTTMPAIYNSAGMEVNTSSTAPLASGYYYLATGAQSTTEIYYNGDGTFVNESSGLYGGSVSDPNGTVGVTLVYGTKEGTVLAGVPNTGVGGNAMAVWMTLVVTGLITAAGVSYLVTHKSTSVAL
jgi:hypothetical protein